MRPSLPPATRALLLINVAVFGLQALFNDPLVRAFALWPPASAIQPGDGSFEVWQLLTYGFLHANLPHILFNMFALWMFGSDVERLLGSRRFVTYYLTCVVGAAVAQLIVERYTGGPTGYTVGASGGVYGVLLAFGLSWPHRKLIVLPVPVPMPAWLLVTLYGLIELYQGVTGTGQGIAHFAHLGGMAAGWVLLIYWRRHVRRTS